MKNLLSRITSDSEICNGKPIIRGMRITVATVLGYMASGESMANILEAYPILEREDVLACLEFARKIADKSISTNDLTLAKNAFDLASIYGAWQDTKDSDAIIKEIKDSRVEKQGNG